MSEEGERMLQTQYSKYFFDIKLPLSNFEAAKTYIADQYGFDRTFIEILRSKDGHICYPLFLDRYNNYIIFTVKGCTYECINGVLSIITGRR